ncbi:Methionine aminopeptidase [Moraxella catarrhalis]|uniref:Methionine aminopeptidase n=3 Tax=Moraxella catarrhalis TaxID=480 RepID=A0A3Q9GF64_MORCA|nr:methionine aminopeptidase type I [Moraxella catarrhalis BBH18]AZQ92655.1 methionine aminopeptidase, type I [Moraxella catarrhalis]AZQ95321.1 methionine aminopeptidase, type I [Moraxella catarrhalis]OAV18686.1 Methionine aminopeptidase [Moraxella catarrhalis]OAV21244.1 Methionine aminopeptidase [Moraxella catarrhalis]
MMTKHIPILDDVAIDKMKTAGKLAADVLVMLDEHVKTGVSTGVLDDIAHQYILDHGAIPAPLNYNGFPKSICTSINHVVCHGIPDHERLLKEGDIINIDITVIKDGYYGDTSKMWIVGQGSVMAQRLCQVAQKALYAGMKVVKNGAHLGDIGAAIQAVVEPERFSIVREFCGHGIGQTFHAEPQVLHYGKAGTGIELKTGMAFTIEPMINQGVWQTKIMKDGWTAITKDRKLSAQWEHTLIVTDNGCLVTTARPDEDLSFLSS